jgi:predicted alpha/beta-hydrolase family hydrolase
LASSGARRKPSPDQAQAKSWLPLGNDDPGDKLFASREIPEPSVPPAAVEPVTIVGDNGIRVSGLLQTPPAARACYVLAHGAGAGVRGLAFLGFPLHPAGRPSQDRAKHLFDVQIPMLFLQGTRDALAMLDQLEPVCQALGARATLKLFADADHSFHVPVRTGRKDAQVRSDMLDALAAWIDAVIAGPAPKRA